MRRPAAALALLALAAPHAAAAHGSIAPTAAPADAVERFVVAVPPSESGSAVVGLTLTAPAGFELERAEAHRPRWTARVRGGTVRWSGGPLAGVEEFAFRARTPGAEGTYEFVGRERYRSGAGPEFRLAVTVTRSAGGTAAAAEDDGAPWAAVGAVALALALAAAVALRRRPARPR